MRNPDAYLAPGIACLVGGVFRQRRVVHPSARSGLSGTARPVRVIAR
jgi:hypothetical protein